MSAVFDFLADTPRFSHERLKLGGNSIRLITLQPDANEYNLISCDISQHPSHNRPPYIALSYMWGSDDEKIPILINGKVLEVRRNLSDCLVQLRKHHREPLTLWIDALCIDQTNVAERNHVVQLMDQVYERAERVFVWLGTGDESSEQAMCFLRMVQRTMKDEQNAYDIFLEKYMLQAVYYKDWVAVVRLFKREYWARLWIIQETLLAGELELFCGEDRILWKSVEYVVTLVKHSFNHFDRRRSGKSVLHAAILETLAARMFLRRAESARFKGGRQTYPSLQTLLETFKDSECADARDEIFGLLSIAGDFHDKRIDYIDYHLRPTEIFVNFLRHYLCHFNDHNDDETLYNVRRLSDALRIDIYDILRERDCSEDAQISHSDLTVDHDDTWLIAPCQILLRLVHSREKSKSSIPHGYLREYSGPMASISPSPSRTPAPVPVPSPSSSVVMSGSPEELAKVRRLARRKAHEACNAFAQPISNDASSQLSDEPTTFKYFTRPFSSSGSSSSSSNNNNATPEQWKPFFGVTCPATQPGDLLVKWTESDLIFVARPSSAPSQTAVYDVIGTALAHADDGTVVRVKSSLRKWWKGSSQSSSSLSPHTLMSPATSLVTSPVTEEAPDIFSGVGSQSQLTVPGQAEQLDISVRFNPLMLLMIVNEPSWRQNIINQTHRQNQFTRQPTSYAAIQPRGSDDPVLQEFGGAKTFTGHAHIDRAANKFFDRVAMNLEEWKERMHYYEDR